MINIKQLLNRLDRYYIQILAIIERKKDYTEQDYQITKNFYNEEIKHLRKEVGSRPRGFKELEKYDLERGFIE